MAGMKHPCGESDPDFDPDRPGLDRLSPEKRVTFVPQALV
jgi:hypothetical protein